MALTKAKLMELIDNGDIDVGGGGFNPNILHNWDFRNPVNQMGNGNVTGSGTHFLDRWKTWGTINNYVTSSKYIQIAVNSSIQQRIETVELAGKTCTFSWTDENDNVFSCTGTFPTVSATYNGVTYSSNITFRFGYSSSLYMYIQMYVGDTAVAVRTVKLELGTVSTLAYDPPMDHAVELLKCMRFFYAMDRAILGAGFSNTSTITARALFPCPVVMRVVPTLMNLNNAVVFVGGYSIPVDVTQITTNQGGIRINGSASGVPTNEAMVMQLFPTSGSFLHFSADL